MMCFMLLILLPIAFQSIDCVCMNCSNQNQSIRTNQSLNEAAVQALDQWYVNMIKLKMLERFGQTQEQVETIQRNRRTTQQLLDDSEVLSEQMNVQRPIELWLKPMQNDQHATVSPPDPLCERRLWFNISLPQSHPNAVRLGHARLRVPDRLWQRAKSLQMQLLIANLEHPQQHVLPNDQLSPEHNQASKVFNLTAMFSTLSPLPSHVTAQLSIQLQADPLNESLSCAQPLRESPTLHLHLVSNPSPSLHVRAPSTPKHKRVAHGRGSSNLIRDCEQQWSQHQLNATSHAFHSAILPCCRRRVTIDFAELGWSQWVLAPASFDSFYCIGKCRDFGGFARAGTSGSALYADIRNQQNRIKAMGLTPCCSPVAFQPLTIMTARDGHERVAQTFDDVIVTQCGCM